MSNSSQTARVDTQATSSGIPGFAWAAGGFLVGAAATLVFSWFAFMAPLRESVAARERAVNQWEALNRSERQAIQDVKTVSVEEMRKWVAEVALQNARFADIERNLHGQEMALATDGTSYLWVAAAVVLGSVLLTVFMVRDKNSASDVTLENIAALTPRQMVDVAQRYAGSGTPSLQRTTRPILPDEPQK